jgi:hypothetical protein
MVQFTASSMPKAGSKAKVIWLYNNKAVGHAAKKTAKIIRSTVRASRGLPKGFWRAQLMIKIPGKPFRVAAEARTRLR